MILQVLLFIPMIIIGDIYMILNNMGFLTSLTEVMVTYGYIWHRIKYPEINRPFKVRQQTIFLLRSLHRFCSIWLNSSRWILKISNVLNFMQVVFQIFLQLHLFCHVFYAALCTVLVVVPLVTKPQESVIGFLIIVLTGVPYYLLFIRKVLPLSFVQGTKRECDIPYIFDDIDTLHIKHK